MLCSDQQYIGKIMRIGEVIGETLVSYTFERLLDRIANSSVVIDFFSRGGLDKAFHEKFKTTLCEVHALLIDAEGKQFTNSKMKEWLDRLQEVSRDAEEVLKEITELEASRRSEEPEPRWKKIKVWRYFSNSDDARWKIVASKLTSIHQKLEHMANQKIASDLIKRSVPLSEESQLRWTTSLVEEANVYGRNQEKRQIVDLLFSRETGGVGKIGVIAIVGTGGLGKTTLAQLVYNDVRVQECFEIKTWVCVSNNFDVVRVTKTILECAPDKSFDMQDLNNLQVKLSNYIRGKRFLIVLDNVWSESNELWELLCGPLHVGAEGSKIIVTTRSNSVASVMGAHCFQLMRLAEGDAWMLFSKYAFQNGVPAGTDVRELEMIGREIVQKCDGWPFLVKELGNFLRPRHEIRHWKDILNSSAWGSPAKISILPALRLRFQ
ncbi:hypothetical protein Ancab_022243 [Ancistrocladus abbreviatus]